MADPNYRKVCNGTAQRRVVADQENAGVVFQQSG